MFRRSHGVRQFPFVPAVQQHQAAGAAVTGVATVQARDTIPTRRMNLFMFVEPVVSPWQRLSRRPEDG